MNEKVENIEQLVAKKVIDALKTQYIDEISKYQDIILKLRSESLLSNQCKKGIDFMFYLQNYFSIAVVWEIWGKNSDIQDWNFPNNPSKKYNYYWDKWEETGRNAVQFYSRMDILNQEQLRNWYKREMNNLEKRKDN